MRQSQNRKGQIEFPAGSFDIDTALESSASLHTTPSLPGVMQGFTVTSHDHVRGTGGRTAVLATIHRLRNTCGIGSPSLGHPGNTISEFLGSTTSAA